MNFDINSELEKGSKSKHIFSFCPAQQKQNK